MNPASGIPMPSSVSFPISRAIASARPMPVLSCPVQPKALATQHFYQSWWAVMIAITRKQQWTAGAERLRWCASGTLPTIGIEAASLIVASKGRHPLYRGVRANIGFPPGVTSALVPLPFCMNKPSPPEPAMVVLAADPTLPITTVDLLEVVAVGSATFWEVCATVAPVSSARTEAIASKDLNMFCLLETVRKRRVLAVPFPDMGTLARLRTVRKLLR